MKNKIFLLLGIILFVASVSATFSFTDYQTKWNLCSALNLSNVSCDLYWANASNFDTWTNNTNDSMNATLQNYFKYFTNGSYLINGTNSTNQTDNLTLDYYYNSSQNGTYILNNSNSTYTQTQVNDLLNNRTNQDRTAYGNLNNQNNNGCSGTLINGVCYGSTQSANYSNNNNCPGTYVNGICYASAQQPQTSSDNSYLVIIFGMIFVVLLVVLIFVFTRKNASIQMEYPINNSQYKMPEFKWDKYFEDNEPSEFPKKKGKQ